MLARRAPALRTAVASTAQIRVPFLSLSSRTRYSTAQPLPAESAAQSLSSRWLSDVKTRIGHCITFGLNPAQKEEAGRILQELSQNWRELVAGSEGFLTSKERRSMYRLPVVWGEQDLMVRISLTQRVHGTLR